MKMKQTLRARLIALSLCGVALAILGSSKSYAFICNSPPPISITFPPLVFEGGADGPTIGQPISSSWAAVMNSPNFLTGDASCILTHGLTLPTMGTRVPGITYSENGLIYPIYATNIPSIGIIMGIKATSAAAYTPVNFPITAFYPDPSPSAGLGISIHAKLIVIGRLTSGVYQIASQSPLYVYGNGPNSTVTDKSDLIINPSTVTIKASTCQILGSNTQNVPLLPVGKTQFSGVGSVAGAPADFSLRTLCGTGVKLYATMTDGSDPGNNGNTLKPAEGTTASGVGVQIFRDGLPIAFGPDSSASGNTNQWYIGSASSGGSEVFTIPLKARYVQTEQNMVAGSVKARATVTFSYQ
ncbi:MULTISPECIES: fimbrial protein [unclassified Serratia (in: enterobacteria)]|uniref:fimbrial protein n=1 Tax=unclassified Serratia (in: enterobacteria) TaxID=2647522 RepID=UPI000B1CB4E5|nr:MULTISPECIES: fimbrial protein [unclassified Serratia (in: enterobacteria)]